MSGQRCNGADWERVVLLVMEMPLERLEIVS